MMNPFHPMKTITARHPLLLLVSIMMAFMVLKAGADPLDKLAKTIAEGKGREVYDAFHALPQIAQTDKDKQKAFRIVAPYLGQFDKRCVVPDYYPRRYHVTQRHFFYGELAKMVIPQLGEPGVQGLLQSLTSKEQRIADAAADILCILEIRAHNSSPRFTNANNPTPRKLTPTERNTMRLFLKQHGDRLPIHYLTSFANAWFPTAKQHMHHRLKNARHPKERKNAADMLGRYGYSPALNDLLDILTNDTDAHLRRIIAGKLANFAERDRTIQALENVLSSEKNTDIRRSCQLALAEIRAKQKRPLLHQ